MADNVTLNSMSGGNTVAADEVTDATLGTAKVQYVKLMDGTLDGTTKGVIDATYGLKVDVARTVNVVLGAGTNAIGATTNRSGSTVGQGTASPTTSATQIVAAVSASPFRRAVTVTNTGTINVYVGGSGVTSGSGILLLPNAAVTITEGANAAIYGITASGTGTVAYFSESD